MDMTTRETEKVELHRRLLSYSAAASLAVAGSLVGTGIGGAPILYTCGVPSTAFVDGEGTIPIDFDLDTPTGDPEFIVHVEAYDGTTSATYDWAKVFLTGDVAGDTGSGVIGSVYGTVGYLYASALSTGVAVNGAAGLETMDAGANSGAVLASNIYASSVNSTPGTWNPGTDGTPTVKYMGLEFDLGGSTYYGWARLRVEPGTGHAADDPKYLVTVEQHCYNQDGGSIVTGAISGEPTAVDLVALEAAGESGLLGIVASGFVGLSGVLLGIRRWLAKRISG